MKKCKGDRSQRKSEAVEKECRTSGGQIPIHTFFPLDLSLPTSASLTAGCSSSSSGGNCGGNPKSAISFFSLSEHAWWRIKTGVKQTLQHLTKQHQQFRASLCFLPHSFLFFFSFHLSLPFCMSSFLFFFIILSSFLSLLFPFLLSLSLVQTFVCLFAHLFTCLFTDNHSKIPFCKSLSQIFDTVCDTTNTLTFTKRESEKLMAGKRPTRNHPP